MKSETMRQSASRPARFLELEERIATLVAWIRGGKAEIERAIHRSGGRSALERTVGPRERVEELGRELLAWNEELVRLERQRDDELAATARRLNERIGRGEGK